MNTQTTHLEKPTLVNVIAWTTLASGIVNLGWGLAASVVALLTIVGICCTPLTILPSILGIFEIIYAAKLLSSPPQAVRPAINLAVLEIVCILTGNVFSMVVGIISLIFYNDPSVKEYFARLNGDLPPAPVPSAPQVPPVVPGPSTSVEEPASEEASAQGAIASPVPEEEPLPSPLTGEALAPVEGSPVPEPEPPVSPSATDQTILSSARRDEAPGPESEPPAAPDESDQPKTPEE